MNVQENLLDNGFEDVICLSSNYDEAFIGLSVDYRAVYDYEKIIRCLMKDGMTDEDAAEWIEYNVVRALPYMDKEGYAPIIMYSTGWLCI